MYLDCVLLIKYFNPRTSCEVRLQCSERESLLLHFNPRTSCEVRRKAQWYLENGVYFNPRTSCEVRHQFPFAIFIILLFQSTHLV